MHTSISMATSSGFTSKTPLRLEAVLKQMKTAAKLMRAEFYIDSKLNLMQEGLRPTITQPRIHNKSMKFIPNYIQRKSGIL